MSETDCEPAPLPSLKPDLESHTSLGTRPSSLLSSCRICLSSLFDPASLACGHRFCEKCLNKYWTLGDKPDFIVCPLCRTSAYTVDFSKKGIKVNSMQDFRNMFSMHPSDIGNINIVTDSTLFCLKISILMPAFYFLAKLLRPPLTSLISFFSDLMVTLVYLI